jgi:hypothetical protein
MKPRDFPKVAGGLPFALIGVAVMFAVMAILVVWSASRRQECLPMEREIIVITLTSVGSLPIPHIPCQP